MNRFQTLSDHSPILAVLWLFVFPLPLPLAFFALSFSGCLTGCRYPDAQPIRHLVAGDSVALVIYRNIKKKKKKEITRCHAVWYPKWNKNKTKK